MIRKLCNVRDLPEEGQLKAFADRHPDSRLSLCVGMYGERIFAVTNICPHQGAELAAGRLDGDTVICPIHSWKWSITNGRPVNPSDPPLCSYEVRQYGDEAFVRIPTDSGINDWAEQVGPDSTDRDCKKS